MRNYRILVGTVLLFVFLQKNHLKAQDGLMFRSNDTLLNKRTSFNVFAYATPRFSDHLIIEFGLSLWDTQNLGYIFSLTGKNNSYSLNYLYTDNKAVLNFNIDKKANKLQMPLQPSQMGRHKWIRVKADFDLKRDAVTFYIDGKLFRADSLGMENGIRPQLVFGKNKYYMEVPQMAIDDLVIEDGHQHYRFPLNEWSGNIAHTLSGEKMGLIENPVWLINRSYFWKQVYTRSFDQVAGLNFDPLDHALFIYGRDSLISLSSDDRTARIHPYRNSLPVSMILGKSIFNTKEDKAYVYEVYNNVKGTVNMASLDMKTLKWEAIGKGTLTEQRHHHNTFYNAAQDSLFLFGGYGGFAYHNGFYCYSRKSDQWERIPFKGDSISPRFFSAAGSAGSPDEVFIFGGYGNATGNQIIGGRQYYDLYRVNLRTHTLKKCWTLHPKEVFVPANNLILSKDKQYFYALCYPHESFKTAVRLYRFSVKDGTYRIVSAPIPVTSERIESDINLFLDDQSNKLLCTIQEFTSPQHSSVRVYTLAFPPTERITASGAMHSAQQPGRIPPELWWALLAALGTIGVIAVRIRKKKRPQQTMFAARPRPALEAPLTGDGGPKPTGPLQNAVYLSGEFAVFDKRGMEITHLFSPKIKQLFLLIFLNSKCNKGISSRKISQTLWPDKEIGKSKNIKGVTVNHLRNAISDIKGIRLSFSNDIYFFETTDPFFSDYGATLNLLKDGALKKDTLFTDHFNLLTRGVFLPDMAYGWLDDFKRDYEKKVLEPLVVQVEKCYHQKNYPMVLSLSQLVFQMDPFNDFVLGYQLKSYRRLMGMDFCQKIYYQFALDYEKSLGIPFPVRLDVLLSH